MKRLLHYIAPSPRWQGVWIGYVIGLGIGAFGFSVIERRFPL
jgi:hypothetical protein